MAQGDQVTVRMSTWRAAASGARNGIILGLFLGLLLGLLSPGFGWFGLLLVGAAIGATWGACFGYAAHVTAK